jgi:UDP-4-amino-4-deoxy-L-arabinose-oxoglutarate aminotransferase
MTNPGVEFYRHDLDASAAEAVAKVLATPFLTSGAVGRSVEQQLSSYFGIPHAALVNSWTSGAVAALLALGIGPGDEVIVPAMTFIATANVVELVGARPIFIDVDPATLLMTPENVRRALTAATRAVIPVHLYGQMVDVKSLHETLRDRPDVAILEDCAHCFEGELGGDKPGAHSTAAIFSFYATKNVTCGEGGALITRDSEFYGRFLKTRLHGMSAGAVDRFKSGSYRHWDMECLGVKANLSDLLAALLPPQIASVDEKLPKREQIARRYEAALANEWIRFPRSVGNGKHARHLFAIHVPPAWRDEIISLLGAQQIGCTVNYRAVPTLTFYRNKYSFHKGHFPVSFDWGEGTLSLPLYPSLCTQEQDKVIAVLDQAISQLSMRPARPTEA